MKKSNIHYITVLPEEMGPLHTEEWLCGEIERTIDSIPTELPQQPPGWCKVHSNTLPPHIKQIIIEANHNFCQWEQNKGRNKTLLQINNSLADEIKRLQSMLDWYSKKPSVKDEINNKLGFAP